MLAGASLQLATPWALRAFRLVSHLGRALRQPASGRAAWLMPIAAWLIGTTSAAAAWVFVAASAYWAASQATGPAWNTWIEEIIPKRVRANFFACRARISQICMLLGFVAGGLALHLATQLRRANPTGWLLAAFAGIFLIGAACRFLSAGFLSQQSEPSAGRYQTRPVSLRADRFARPAATSAAGSCCICSRCKRPCRSPGRTSRRSCSAQERLSYLSYMVLIGIGFLGKVIALPLWGRVAHYAGARRLLWIGGTSIVPIAGLWVFIDSFHLARPTITCRLARRATLPISGQILYIGCVQLISGIVWAAYELAMLLMFFEAIPRQDRAGVLTFYNFGNAAALVVGSLIGAAILQLGENHRPTWSCSACRRSSGCSPCRSCGGCPTEAVEIVQPAVRVIAVRPDEGGVDRPILPSLSESSSVAGTLRVPSASARTRSAPATLLRYNRRMIPAPIAADEQDRLADLAALRLLDTPARGAVRPHRPPGGRGARRADRVHRPDRLRPAVVQGQVRRWPPTKRAATSRSAATRSSSATPLIVPDARSTSGFTTTRW